ncbi:MAG: type II toxin-antitoxin system HicB family antitoxin [Actinomycetota bacterium]|nr:type II toxin-antitoxin system HicB family antitoxin [Actinomycetota bacterium]
MSKYIVVIEESKESYSAFSPDLPGALRLGGSLQEVECLMKEPTALHIESLTYHGDEVPLPR